MPEAPAAPAAPPGWDFLLSEAGEDHLRRAQADLSDGRTLLELNSSLRKEGLDPERTAALLQQLELRRKARAKFGEVAGRLLFTPAGLEQATRARAAALHAERFRAAGCSSVADLGCGIGAESAALIAAGIDARPVELDPFTARLAEHNLEIVAAQHGRPAPRVRVGDAEALGAGSADAAFLDPARRTAGLRDTRRLASPSDYSPSLDFAFDLGRRLPTGVKLGPGLDRDFLPSGAEAQWVSVDGELVETGIWFGPLARSGVGRSALVLRGTDGVAELSAPEDAPDAEVVPRGEFLYEPDGAVIRARLIGMLAERLSAGMLSDGLAYLTGSHHVETPFATAFRIVEELPVREKDLRRELAAREIGTLEIKKRGADVDPSALRGRLRLKGKRRATLFMTRAEGRHVALLAERVPG